MKTMAQVERRRKVREGKEGLSAQPPSEIFPKTTHPIVQTGRHRELPGKLGNRVWGALGVTSSLPAPWGSVRKGEGEMGVTRQVVTPVNLGDWGPVAV